MIGGEGGYVDLHGRLGGGRECGVVDPDGELLRLEEGVFEVDGGRFASA